MFVFLKSRRQHTEKKRKLKYQKTELIQCGGVDKKKPKKNWKLWHQLLRDVGKPTMAAALTVYFRAAAANSSVKCGLFLFPFTFKKSETRKLENRWEENWKGKEMKWRKELFTDTEHWTRTHNTEHTIICHDYHHLPPPFIALQRQSSSSSSESQSSSSSAKPNHPFSCPFVFPLLGFLSNSKEKKWGEGKLAKESTKGKRKGKKERLGQSDVHFLRKKLKSRYPAAAAAFLLICPV